MLRRRRTRLSRDEEGFSLIELMVVVLIIAILLAIAIPTFLGSRARAQNRAAESTLRNALTAEKTAYTDSQSFVAAAATMSSIEPGLSWASAMPAAGNGVWVQNVGTANNGTCIIDVSASGNEYGITDVATSDGASFSGTGTFYGMQPGGSTLACPTATSTGGVTGPGWSTTQSGAGW